MIIDSHAHYNNNAYKKLFRYLSYDKDGYSLKEGELPQLMQEMEAANICYFIENNANDCLLDLDLYKPDKCNQFRVHPLMFRFLIK